MAEANSLTSTFRKAVDSFKTTTKLTPAEMQEFQLTTLSDLKKAISCIQQQQQKSRKMVYNKRLGTFLEAMEQYNEVITAFLNVSNFVAFIWGPMKFLLVVASSYVEAFNALLDGYAEIGENIPLLAQYQQLFSSKPYMQKVLGTIFEDILEFHQEAVRHFKNKLWRQLFRATWRPLNKKIQLISRRLGLHKKLFEGHVDLAIFEEILSTRRVVCDEFERSRKEEQDNRRIAVNQWLCAINSENRQEYISRRRHPGTGEWLLRHPQFQRWYSALHCSDPLLWITGIPGAGKSVLASLVIQEAKKLSNVRTTFFYCKNGDNHKNGFVNVAKSIISQLLIQNEPLLDHIYETMAFSGEAILSTFNLARELLETALRSNDNTYVILDGLDEYSRDDRKEISSWFQNIVQSVPVDDLGCLRCLFISQDDGCARKDLSMLSQIKLTVAENKTDIELYCRSWQEKIEKKFELRSEEHNITSLVTARAQEGMFLYAKLVTSNLYEQPTRYALNEELQPHVFPAGLEQAYGRILERITSSEHSAVRGLALRLLGWLVCAKRPLKWYEIQAAMAIDLENGQSCPDRRLQVDCKDLCSSLVEHNADESVMLVHPTVKRYLVDQTYVNPLDSEADLANICLAYLSFDEFEDKIPDSSIETALMTGCYGFSDYAVCFWGMHLEYNLEALKRHSLERFRMLAERLELFLECHWDDPVKKLVVSRKTTERLKPLDHLDSYERACQAVGTLSSHLRPNSPDISDTKVLDIFDMILRIRVILERFESANTSVDCKNNLTILYGPNWFKCPRLNCQFYFIGFSSQVQRRDHVSKHERAFTCPEPGCPQATIGCTTKKDLQKHLFEYHGLNFEKGETEFNDIPKFTKSAPMYPATFECNLCPKKLSTAYNLKIHLRSHSGERLYTCKDCGRDFARSADLNRHMDLLHDTEKKFKCEGKFKRGGQWGCGRGFSRRSFLMRHLKSQAGQSCIDALLEEEAAIKTELISEGRPSSFIDCVVRMIDADTTTFMVIYTSLLDFRDAAFAEEMEQMEQIGEVEEVVEVGEVEEEEEAYTDSS